MSNAETNETPTAFEIIPLEEVAPGTPNPAPAPFDPVTAGEQMAKQTVVYEFHMGRPGFVKPLPPDEFIRKIKEAGEQNMTAEQAQMLAQYRQQIVTVTGPNGEQTDTTMLRISQDLLDRAEIGKIVRHDDRFSAWLKAQSIPSPMLAPGMYQINIKRVEEIENAVQVFVTEREKLINQLGTVYFQLEQQAKMRRWPFYEPSDYPSWAIIREKYYVKKRIITFNVPAALEAMNNAIYEQAKQQLKSEWADAAQEARDAQRIALQQLLEHYTTMLGRNEDGKRRTFSPSAVKKLQDFLKMFDELNITGDIELATIVQKTREVISGADIDTLRKSMDLRDTMETAVSEIKKQADTLVVVKSRKVVFKDADQEATVVPVAAPTLVDEDVLPMI